VSLSGEGAVPTRGALDNLAVLEGADRSGMLGLISTIPDQIADAWTRTRGLELPSAYRELRAVAVLGMGGSAIGGDLVAGIWSDRLRVPLIVLRGYELPAWVDASTLVVASSNSGNTEETLTALGVALARKAPIAAITSGGALATAARRASMPLLTQPASGMPRAAVGYAVTLLAGLLERAGMLEVEEREIEAAIAHARSSSALWGPAVPTSDNPAKQLAWTLVDRWPVIEASGFLVPVARRWKTQLNENAKSSAACEEIPEATHNTVVGYPNPEPVKDHLFVVFLASALDHARNRLRAALSAAALDDAQIAHQQIAIEGENRFNQALSAIVLGDFVSAYLAVLYGTDPTPIEVLTGIKEALAAADLDVWPAAAKRT
jgi:glucose/mannose-6-phosphate isomerase